MRRMARTAATAAFLSTVSYAAGSAATGAPTAGGAVATGLVIACLFAAVAAVGVAAYAIWNTRRSNAEITRLSRSLDAALRAIAARTDATEAGRLELEHRLRREIESLAEAAASPLPQTAEIVPHPAAAGRRRLKPNPEDAIETRLASALDDDTLEVSLQPIVSVARNAGVAFDVHACIEVDGQTHHVHRLASDTPQIERRVFEKTLVLRAAEIARRRLGARSEPLPLHCPISAALLEDAQACAEIAELVSIHPVLADQLVLSIDARHLATVDAKTRPGFDRLASSGLGFAAEGWDRPAEEVATLRDRATICLKVRADRLLDRSRIRRAAAPGTDLAAAALSCDLVLVATEIRSDEDAVELLDLGIDLMSGPRFAEPMRLRPPAALAVSPPMADMQVG